MVSVQEPFDDSKDKEIARKRKTQETEKQKQDIVKDKKSKTSVDVST